MSRPATDARQRVLDSATVVFARRGYSGASVQELLRATGLSKPTLYYYFGSKEGLFRAVLDFAYDESYRRLESAARSPGSVEQRLAALVKALFSFTREYRELCRLVIGTTFAAPEEVPPRAPDPARRQRAFDLFAEVIQQGRQSGVLDAGFSTRELTRALLGLSMHQVRVHLLDPNDPLTPRVATRIVQLFLDGSRCHP